MSTFVHVADLLFCVLVTVTAAEVTSCDKLGPIDDIERVKECPAQANNALKQQKSLEVSVSTVETDVTVDSPCRVSGYRICDICKPLQSSQILDYSLTDFTAIPDNKLVNGSCVNAVALSWKLTRYPKAANNMIFESLSAHDLEEYDDDYYGSHIKIRTVAGSSGRPIPDHEKYTIAFKMCFYHGATSACTLAVEIKSTIPEGIDAQSYNCLSFITGRYNISMYTYPQLSGEEDAYKTELYADESQCSSMEPTISGSYMQATISTDTMLQLINVVPVSGEQTALDENWLVGAIVGGVVATILLTAFVFRLVTCNIRSVTEKTREQNGSVSKLPTAKSQPFQSEVVRPRLLVAVDGDLDLLLSQDGASSEAATVSDFAAKVPPAVLSSAVRHLSHLLRLRCRCDVAVVADSFYAVEPAIVDIKSARSPDTPAAVVVVHREPPPKSRQHVQQFVDVHRTVYDAWAKGTWREKLWASSRWIGLVDEPDHKGQIEQLEMETFHVYFRVPDMVSDCDMSVISSILHESISPENSVRYSALQVVSARQSNDCSVLLAVDVATQVGSDATSSAERQLNIEFDSYEVVSDIDRLCSDICRRFQTFALRQNVSLVDISNPIPPDVGQPLLIAIVDCLAATAAAAAAEDDVATVSGNLSTTVDDDMEWFTSVSVVDIDRDKGAAWPVL